MEKHWQKVKEIFAGALLLLPEARGEYISQQCKNDENLRKEVETLLDSHESSEGFMDSPAIGEVVEEIHNPQLGRGESLNQYQIIRRLGTGGTGEVYLAVDNTLNRKVAIKILSKSFSDDIADLRRFLREAKLASSLNHPNILVVHEIGVSDDLHYIVNEYIDGETLNDYVNHRDPSLIMIVEICIQICQAMTAAHKVGIIHRDIKPENIMVRDDGILKVLDFGLAKLTHNSNKEIGRDAQTEDIVSTKKGVIMGTVAYMSPEQTRAKEVESRSDLWSFGVVLFQLLTGELPFPGETTSDIIASILRNEPPSILRFIPNIPNEFEEIISKTLKKDPNERYSTADQILQDLKRIRRQLKQKPGDDLLQRKIAANLLDENDTDSYPTTNTVERSDSYRYRLRSFITDRLSISTSQSNWLALLLLLATAASFTGYFAFYYSKSSTVPTDARQQMQFAKLTDERLAVPLTAISPDGNLIAYIVKKDVMESLRVRQTAGSGVSDIRPLGKNVYQRLQFSANGETIYFTASKPNNDSALFEIPIIGGSAKLIADDVDGNTSTVSPDGKLLAFVRGQKKITIVDLKTEARRIISETSLGEFYSSIAWQSDGKTLTASLSAKNNETSFLLNISIENGTTQQLKSPPWTKVYKTAWLKDGSGIIVNGRLRQDEANQIWLLAYPGGDVRRITNDTNDYFGLDLTANNESLVSGKIERVMNIWVTGDSFKFPGQKTTFNSGKNDGALGVAWTSDRRIIYTVGRANDTDIWSANIDGSENQKITSAPSSEFFPKISPDGQRIVYISDESGNNDIWSIKSDGTSPVQITKTNAIESFPSLTPDGNWVVFDRTDQEGKKFIWKVRVDGGDSVRLTRTAIETEHPVVSPDSSLFVCIYGKWSSEIGPKLALYSIDGGKPIKILDLPNVVRSNIIRWAADGRSLIYIDDSSGADNLWRQPLEGGPPTQLTKYNSQEIMYFDVSKDEDEILLARGEEFFEVIKISGFR